MKNTKSIYSQYFDITRQYTEKYGENTILFYQVGAFFEMYGEKDNEILVKSRITDFAQIAQLNVSPKESGIYFMAGFRDYCLDKYLKIATTSGYTAVVYTQNAANPKSITRELYGVFSPGTFISYDTDSSRDLTNNIVCVWLAKTRPINSPQEQLICGISSAHIFTGETTIFEYDAPLIMNPTTFDELERSISIIAPSEVIVISFLSDKQTDQVLQYSGLKTATIHRICMDSELNKSRIEKIENSQKQKYISHILTTFFGEEAYSVCREFDRYTIATQAFCYLLDFLQEHNPDLVKKIQIPIFQNTQYRMVLANHTLKQLNIIDDYSMDGKKSGHFSSVLAFLNRCCTPMGRRGFKRQLTNPISDSEWLNREYSNISILLDQGRETVATIRAKLNKICDLEKICRQIVVKRVYPNSIFRLYESICVIKEISAGIITGPLGEFLSTTNTHVGEIAEKIAEFIDSILHIPNCRGCESVNNFSENIIREGVSVNLDKIAQEYKDTIILFDKVRETLNSAISKSENKPDDYVKVHETEKSGSTLQITKKRGEILKRVLTRMGSETIEFTPDFIIPIKDIRFIKASASNEEIEFPQLTTIIKKRQVLKERISEEIARAFVVFLKKLETDWYESIEMLISWITKLDIIQSKTYVAREYNYCKPIIDDSNKPAYFDARGLRHVLIEHIQQNEVYVANDLALSAEGILIFGTNAVGKTSIIRAIGICIIMAQTGMYVPCTHFSYKPYTAIFSRILGNDNIFKGLSTFAVEMSELRIILKMADENSLVLGDEVCSGTESESALAIFSTALIELHEKRCTYLFATHFHEITKYDEIKALDRLGLKHMTVHYDPHINGLVYDRIIKEGQGTRMYGLEVCKSLYMDPDFLERAYSFRNKYFPDQKGGLGFSSANYNAKKIRGYCEVCKDEIAEEIHHLSPQKKSTKDGFIDGFHKNHMGNLTALCEKCHKKIHETENNVAKRKTTKGYQII